MYSACNFREDIDVNTTFPVTADVPRLEFTSKVHVQPLLSVEHLDGVKKHYALRIFR